MADSDWYKIATANPGDPIENDYNGEEWTKLDSNHEAAKAAINALPKNELEATFSGAVKVVDTEYRDEDPCYLAAYCGGLNGGKLDHKWEKYLDLIKSIIGSSNFKRSWICDLWNDCCDDIWYLVIGFRL